METFMEIIYNNDENRTKIKKNLHMKKGKNCWKREVITFQRYYFRFTLKFIILIIYNAVNKRMKKSIQLIICHCELNCNWKYKYAFVSYWHIVLEGGFWKSFTSGHSTFYTVSQWRDSRSSVSWSGHVTRNNRTRTLL